MKRLILWFRQILRPRPPRKLTPGDAQYDADRWAG